jgi:hypoxanthine-DNA glycosylase
MPRIRSFEPIERKDAKLLILGSMPGGASLAATRYYANPQNAFWRIMADLLQFDPEISYAKKLVALRAARIAVWDVLHSCHRDGSLDASIRNDTANDFASFFVAHRAVDRVLFNGTKAADCYRRLVLARGVGEGLVYERLPSTSPANASWSYARKLAAWREAVTKK